MTINRLVPSFQLRLLLSFVLVLVIAIGALSFAVSLVAEQEAERYQEEVNLARTERLRELLLSQFSESEFDSLQSTLSPMSRALGWHILLRDSAGEILAYSGEQEGLPSFVDSPEAWVVPVYSNGREVGRLQIKPMEQGETTIEPPPSRLVSAFRRSLMWTGLAAGSVGMVLLFFATRPLLVPVRHLTSAARRVATGDMSQRVKIDRHDEIGQLSETFNAMTAELERNDNQRRQLFADIAHELRTPLSNARGYLEAIREGVFPPNQKTLGAIERQVLYLSKLVEDLRILTQAESGSLDLSFQPDSMKELLRTSVEAFRLTANNKGVDLILQVPQFQPLVIMDRTRITQVIGNLLQNAIIHTPQGGTITVTEEIIGDEMVVSVSDTGSGIPAEACPHIFERFYRYDKSRSRVSGGTGLGLAIARQLVQVHGGRINVISQEGEGSCFTFFLPLKYGGPVQQRRPARFPAQIEADTRA